MLQSKYPLYLANRPLHTKAQLEVTDKYSGGLATRVSLADAALIDRGIAAAVAAEPAMRDLRPYERRRILDYCVERFTERQEDLAQTLCIEAGKPIRDSRGEVSRLIDTFRIAADESIRIGGEIMNLEISPRARGYRGMFRRFPIGACSFIAPYNFPLNLVAHKIAPALAVGCPFILKPASSTPVGALLIGEVLAGAGLPEGAFSILPAHRDGADLFTTDDRLKLLSFTGSADVGWKLKAMAGCKKTVLELGGNAACVIEPDWGDMDDALDRVVLGAFYQSGQSCISVQRILVHESIYTTFRDELVERTKHLTVGDPADEQTFIGPMISEKEAGRLEKWVLEAVRAGAKVLCGGTRMGGLFEATLLEAVADDLSIAAEEAFGPVAILESYKDFGAALHRVNQSRYGLQAGIFTRDLYKMEQAWNTLEVGGVIIGDVPSWRVDNMPYGGVKDSGLGREGVRFAMEDMTEIRNLVIRTP